MKLFPTENKLIGINTTQRNYSIKISEDQVKEDKMGRACSTNGGEEECI
jgi:hypothetical protein